MFMFCIIINDLNLGLSMLLFFNLGIICEYRMSLWIRSLNKISLEH